TPLEIKHPCRRRQPGTQLRVSCCDRLPTGCYGHRMPTAVPAAAPRQEDADASQPLLRILSLGAGVQSTTVLLIALHGEFPERLNCAIFADTGWEPQAVYHHLDWLEGKAREGGIRVHRVSSGNLHQDLLDAAQGKSRAA